MNIPFSSRMSTWDVPPAPPEPDPFPAENTSGGSGDPAVPALSEAVPETPADGIRIRPLLPPAGREPPATAQVRFLNAVTVNGACLRISQDRRLLSSSLSPGGLSGYFTVPAGFRSFSFCDAECPWLLLFRSTLPLADGDVVTLAVIPSGSGLDLVRVDDRPCGVRGADYACLRCVDLVRNGPPLDLTLSDGRVVFSDLRFKEVSDYRRARAGRYDLFLSPSLPLPGALTTDIETVEELPRVLLSHASEPPVSLLLDLRAGCQVSLYLLGDWDLSREIRELTAENF